MARLVRKSAALIAAYAIALQALVAGFAAAGHFGFDLFAVMCTADCACDGPDRSAAIAAAASAAGIARASDVLLTRRLSARWVDVGRKARGCSFTSSGG